MTVITARTADSITAQVHVLHYTYRGGELRGQRYDTAEAAQEAHDRYASWGEEWQPRHVTVELVSHQVGDKVEVSAFGRMRQAVVVGIGRTKVKLEVVKNAQGGKHLGSYDVREVHSLDRPAVDVTPVPELTVTPGAEAALERRVREGEL